MASWEGLGPWYVQATALSKSRRIEKDRAVAGCRCQDENARMESLSGHGPMRREMPTVPGAGIRYIGFQSALACHPHDDARDGTINRQPPQLPRPRSVSH